MKQYKFLSALQSLEFIEEVWLFCSRARGDNDDRSDIDLAILCKDASEKNWLQVMNIINNADTLLKIDCIKFDKNIENELYNNILRDKKVIYVKKSN